MPKAADQARAEQAKALAQFQKMALRCFRAAVEKQSGNVPAVVGTAAALAARGDLATAARLMAQARGLLQLRRAGSGHAGFSLGGASALPSEQAFC